MSTSNQVSINIPPEVVDTVKGLYAQITAAMEPYLITLTNSQQAELPKLGEKSLPFVIKGSEYLSIPGTPTPPYLEVGELNADLRAYETIRQIRQAALPTIEMLDDTMLLCGSEAYVAVLAFYNYLKGAAKMGVPGAKTIYEDLSSRFPGRTMKKEV